LFFNGVSGKFSVCAYGAGRLRILLDTKGADHEKYSMKRRVIGVSMTSCSLPSRLQ